MEKKDLEIKRLRKLLKETCFRAQFALPIDMDSMKWFDQGANYKLSGTFIKRLYRELGLDKEFKLK